MHKSKIISILLLSASLFYIGCSETLVPPTDNSINIEFPIGKKAIYATGVYLGDSVDSLTPLGINIFSLQFNSVSPKTDGVEYIGEIEIYNPLISGTDVYQDSGKIVVSVDDKWVLFQNSDILGSGMIFMKRGAVIADTTLFPTSLNYQFPIFPKRITPNTQYSVYRPGSTDSKFIAVQRDFDVKNYTDWNDIYGNIRGLYYETKHIIPDINWELNITGILDSKGVVVSSFPFKTVISSAEFPDGGDSVMTHSINRRIVDFTEPENVKDLLWYYDYVLENGLTYIWR
ncbi:MAG: hypothetical protein L3J41_05080 [Melioribacteraceae bacterium]|nr:hypothetical protein [Melioribacteraceae bacterium]